MNSHLLVLGLLILASGFGSTANGNDEMRAESPLAWPQFRGSPPGGDVSTSVPIDVGGATLWKVNLTETAYSSPIVQNDEIFLTSASEEHRKLKLLVFDFETGTQKNSIVLGTVDEFREKHAQNSYATPTPVLDGQRLYLHFGSYGTYCVSQKTKQVIWKNTSLECFHRVGPASSPMLHGDLVYLQLDGFDVQYLVALNKFTGEEVWRHKRKHAFHNDENDEWKKSYSTPIMVTHDGKTVLVNIAASCMYGLNPENGEEIWRFPFKGFSITPQPVRIGDRLVFSSGFGEPTLHCIELQSSGAPKSIWSKAQFVPRICTPIADDSGLLFSVTDNGVGTMWDTESGELLWKERLGNTNASPLCINGRVFILSVDGTARFVNFAKEYSVQSEFKLDPGCHATPAVYKDCLVIRADEYLLRFGRRK